MFYIALRQLFSRKKQTLLILLGVTLGSLIYILIASIQLGMRAYMLDALLNNTSHIRIRGGEDVVRLKKVQQEVFGDKLVRWKVKPAGKRSEPRLENYYGWTQRLQKHPEVLAYAPKIESRAMIVRGKIKTNISLFGIVPSLQTNVTDLDDYVVEGNLFDLERGGNKIILGSGVIKDLGAQLGDNVTLINAHGEKYPYRIAGITHFGSQEVDRMMAFGNLLDVQKINHTPGRVSEISVALTDIDLSKPLAAHWDSLNQDKVEDWQQANKSFMEIIKIQDVVRVVIMVSMLLIVSFGIYNVLSIMINQKKKEIAILRAIGFTPKSVLELFLIQGFLLGLFGSLLGMVLGYFACLYVESIDLGIEIGKGNHMIMSYAPSIFFVALWSSLSASLLASLLPALTASKMSPMQIIRSE